MGQALTGARYPHETTITVTTMNINPRGLVRGTAILLALAFASAPQAENIWLFQGFLDSGHGPRAIAMDGNAATRDSAQDSGAWGSGPPGAMIGAWPRTDGAGTLAEMILIEAGPNQLLELHNLSIGWSAFDSDLTVLAYTASQNPTDPRASRRAAPQDIASAAAAPAPGQRVRGSADASSHDGPQLSGFMQKIFDNTGTAIAAKYWLISAYNPETNGNGAIEQCGSWQGAYATCYDYAKLAAISGILANTPQSAKDAAAVPEPSPAWLLGLGVILLNRLARPIQKRPGRSSGAGRTG